MGGAGAARAAPRGGRRAYAPQQPAAAATGYGGQPGSGIAQPPPAVGQQQPGMGATMGGAQPAVAQQPRGKGIDPDQVPNPIAVNIADQEKFNGVQYNTSSQLNPPMVATQCEYVEDGNASPKVMRSTLYAVPQSDEVLVQAKTPFAVMIRPLADPTGNGAPVPVVDHGPDGPIRCSRCKAYMNPGFKFVDGGRSFKCNFCPKVDTVPEHYFCNLDHTGQRHDIMQRPELINGTVDYKATSVYCPKGRQTAPLSYLFVIDVSYTAVKSGLVAAASQSILALLDSFPASPTGGSSEVKVGIMTYSKDISFFNLKAGLAQPQMMVVGDTEDPFVPLRDGLLVNLTESREVIESLLTQLPHMFEHTRVTEPVMGSAVLAATDALQYCGGKMMIFTSVMPTVGPGKLKTREDVKLLGTDKEKSLLTPQIEFYQKQAEKCVERGISADLFICNQSYYDISSVGMLSHVSGGSLFNIPRFNGPTHTAELLAQVRRVITRNHGFDAMMRVRASMGLRPTDFCGSFMMTDTSNMSLAGCDEDKVYVVEIKHDAKLDDGSMVAIQAALLYTTAQGERRIRVHTLQIRSCSQIADVFRATDMESVVTALAKRSIRDHRRQTLADLRNRLKKESVDILAAYRKHCTAANTAHGQLILPECLKLLPCFVSCVVKTNAFRGGATIGSDVRMASILHLISSSVEMTIPYIYPRLLQIDNIDPAAPGTMPAAIRPSYARLKENGAYLLENGQRLFLWVGSKVSANFCLQVLDAGAFQSIDSKQTKLPALDNPLSGKCRAIVDAIHAERNCGMPLTIVKQKDPTEVYFAHMLLEDKTNESLSYVDFLCLLHRDIQVALQ